MFTVKPNFKGGHAMKKRVSRLVVLLVVLAMISTIVGCQSASQQPSTSQSQDKSSEQPASEPSKSDESEKPKAEEPKLEAKDIKIGLIYSIAIPFFNPCDAAAEDISKELGIKVIIEKPPKASVDEQIKIIENMIAQGVNGLVICSVGEGIDPVINEAVDSGIPVFMFAVDNVKSKRLAYFGTNQKDYAEKAAKYMADLIGGKGVVCGNGGVATAPDQLERAKYFKEYIEANYDIKVADIQYGNNDAVKTLSNIEGMINTNKPNGFWAFNSMSGGTLAAVVKDIGKKNIKTLADNDYPDIIKGVREGYLDATLTQAPYTMAYEAIKKMVDLLVNGTKPEKTFYYTDTVFITKENADEYFDAENKAKAFIKSELK